MYDLMWKFWDAEKPQTSGALNKTKNDVTREDETIVNKCVYTKSTL